jgi:uroporphyrinogen-III synthase
VSRPAARGTAEQTGSGAAAPLPGLEGRTVVVTRPEVAPGPLEQRLTSRGARVLRWNVLEIAPPGDPTPLTAALAALAAYDWIMFTSANAVAAVTGQVNPPDGDCRPRVAAVGNATARELAAAGWPVDLVPERFSAAGIRAALAGRAASRPPESLEGRRVLLPASAIARDELAGGLEAAGAVVTRVEAYRTLPHPLDRGACLEALERGEIDAVTFASPSAVEALLGALSTTSGEPRPGAPGDHDDRALAALALARLVAIGPTTAAALSLHGLAVAAEATPHTLDGLVTATEQSLATPVHRRTHHPADPPRLLPVG